MSSSPNTAVVAQSDRTGELMDLLAQVPDPRDPRGVRYPLSGVLALAVTAVLAGARSFAAIASWAGDLAEHHLARIGVEAAPDESTLRKLFARVDADVLDQKVGAFCWTRTRVANGRWVIAVDGKAVRGAGNRADPGQAAPHLLAALDHASGAVAGQNEVAAKSNEIPAVPELLGCFDLTEAVVTVDAMHTQTDTAKAITDAGGDDVFTVKKNQPRLHAACKNLPWKHVPAHRVTTTGHGRRITRTIKVLDEPA